MDLEAFSKMQITSNAKIGWCYLPKFDNVEANSSTEELETIFNPKRVFSKIEHEAFDGEDSFSAIGTLNLSFLMDKRGFSYLMLPGLVKFVETYKSPLLIDICKLDSSESAITWLCETFNEELREYVVLTNFEIKVESVSN